jgi:hypothetical protein
VGREEPEELVILAVQVVWAVTVVVLKVQEPEVLEVPEE